MPLPIVIETEPISSAPRDWIASKVELISRPYSDRRALLNDLHRASGLLVRTYTIVDRELLDHAPNLRVVARAGVGLDNIDLDACKERGIAVVHTPSANTQSVVEYVAWALILGTRNIHTLQSDYSTDNWHETRKRASAERSLVDQTLGIIGFGRIGSRVATLARALSMRVQCCDLIDIPDAQRAGIEQVSMEQLVRTSDAITIHVDGRASNRALMSADVFSLMKSDALLINAARGFVVDPSAAREFARSNPQSRLVLDVHDPEPLDDPGLLALPNVLLTPHIASGTAQAKEAMSWVVRDLVRVLEGQTPEHRAV
jgi:phosphoglycerate dehydrogenase-like enzyme